MPEHKHAEVLRAIADGKVVQWRDGGKDWVDYDSTYRLPNPLYNFYYAGIEWRIKPETKSDYVVYAGYDYPNSGYLYHKIENVSNRWPFIMKITISGETNEPISVELVKKP